MARSLSEAHVLARLKTAVYDAGSVSEFARRAGVSQPYVYQAMTGKTTIGPRILDALGIERVVVYRRKA